MATSTARDIVEIEVEGGVMRAHRWLPAGVTPADPEAGDPAPGEGVPGVMVLQEIFGISDYIERRCQELADQGYAVLAPEIFWRLGQTRVEMGEDALGEAMALLSRLDWADAVTDAAAAFDWLQESPEVEGPSGIVGFCFGGGLGFNVAAITDPDVLVSFYGSALPGLLDLAPSVTAVQQHHFGLADSYIPSEEVAKIEAAVADHGNEFHTYPGADHAFDNDDFVAHHPEASALAWQRTLTFLKHHLADRA